MNSSDIRKHVKYLKQYEVPKGIVKDQAEVTRLNRLDKNLLGIEGKWKVGDEYYSFVMRQPWRY